MMMVAHRFVMLCALVLSNSFARGAKRPQSITSNLRHFYRGSPVRIFDFALRGVVGDEPAVKDSSGPDRQVVDISDPLLREPRPATAARGIRPVHDETKIIWPIDGAKRQAYWQKLAATGHNCQHLLRPTGIFNLVKARDRVDERVKHAAGGLREYVACFPAMSE